MSDSPNVLRISAKTLGELALPDFCPRCVWLKSVAGMPSTHAHTDECVLLRY